MIYAVIKKDDPRVKAAIDWCRANWTLDENPGLRENDPSQAKNGLYYYFNAMAKALHAYGEPVITDTSGKQHDWRVEMIHKIASLQQADGSWVGEKRWMENVPLIVTSYTVLALEEVQKDLVEHPAK
jgi:squalene-hopene/tetraprenyl-beta-curcumene cyclase